MPSRVHVMQAGGSIKNSVLADNNPSVTSKQLRLITQRMFPSSPRTTDDEEAAQPDSTAQAVSEAPDTRPEALTGQNATFMPAYQGAAPHAGHGNSAMEQLALATAATVSEAPAASTSADAADASSVSLSFGIPQNQGAISDHIATVHSSLLAVSDVEQQQDKVLVADTGQAPPAAPMLMSAQASDAQPYMQQAQPDACSASEMSRTGLLSNRTTEEMHLGGIATPLSSDSPTPSSTAGQDASAAADCLAVSGTSNSRDSGSPSSTVGQDTSAAADPPAVLDTSNSSLVVAVHQPHALEVSPEASRPSSSPTASSSDADLGSLPEPAATLATVAAAADSGVATRTDSQQLNAAGSSSSTAAGDGQPTTADGPQPLTAEDTQHSFADSPSSAADILPAQEEPLAIVSMAAAADNLAPVALSATKQRNTAMQSAFVRASKLMQSGSAAAFESAAVVEEASGEVSASNHVWHMHTQQVPTWSLHGVAVVPHHCSLLKDLGRVFEQCKLAFMSVESEAQWGGVMHMLACAVCSNWLAWTLTDANQA